MSDFKAGDLVRDGRGKVWKIVSIAPVFGIPAAHLIHVRKDGTTGILRRKNYVNRPLSYLEKVAKPLVEVI